MKVHVKKYRFLLLAISLFFNLFLANSQGELPPESIDLLVDRGVFSSGEKVLFSGQLTWIAHQESLSKVVYIELISPIGQKLAQKKIKVLDTHFEGSIEIPLDILSGYYFVRAYTKWMRNGSVYEYAYARIKIINPFNEELNFIPDSLIDMESNDDFDIAFNNKLNKNNYKKGEDIRLDQNKSSSSKFSVLSIIPYKSDRLAYFGEKSNGYTHINFYPETRGISLSGKVIVGDSIPSAYHIVNLHLQNEKDFISTVSDSLGRFYISFPERHGKIEILALPSSSYLFEPELVIDQDYCSKEISLKVPIFKIDQHDQDLLNIIQRSQVQRYYHQEDTANEIKTKSQPFYGSKVHRIDLDSFVELDSLAQYFSDLNSFVGMKREKGLRKLFVQGPESELKLYAPLILVDWVPVDDDESVLNLNPARIKKFEVISRPYIHGDILYGGVLSIFTRNGDFGGFKFPEAALYLSFDFFSDNESTADFKIRNTYNWIPSFDENELDLKAPEANGKYILMIQSIDTNGEKSFYKNEFRVE